MDGWGDSKEGQVLPTLVLRGHRL